jgi:hypothetical protein
MITAWDIYWVMQLDSIGAALSFLSAGGLMLAVALTVWNGISRFDTNEFPSLCDVDARKAAWAVRANLRKTVLLVAVPLFVVNAFIPSTKTAATMIVLPAVANNETVQREAGELYGIAKDALRELAKPDAPEPQK